MSIRNPPPVRAEAPPEPSAARTSTSSPGPVRAAARHSRIRSSAHTLPLFFSLLIVLAGAAYVWILRANTQPRQALPTYLLMWSPAVAALVTSLFCFRSLRGLGFGFSRRALPWLVGAVAAPVLYTMAIYLPLEVLGIVQLGPPHLNVQFLVLYPLMSTLLAAGEEIGWRGFLVPQLAARLGFVRGNLVVGILWMLFHVPLILFAGYRPAANLFFGLACFTVTVLCTSFFLGAARLRSGSVWPAAVFHGVHNLVLTHLFAPIESTSPASLWLADEQGVLLCVPMAVLAGIGIVAMRRAARTAPFRAAGGDGAAGGDEAAADDAALRGAPLMG